ncbi:ATP-binding cassette domain-containing protein [Anaerolentibacter hominis]|uniref:ATP-binding cassette domain-containing protein n=1 Tax=Anaerolentibacter hominis TaxID=3079009 RepID=UPI0031B89222
MHNSQTAIQVQNLKKKFKEKEVLRGVTFRIDKGTVFCLLGSNGAGKTTTVKILSTLLKMDEGSAAVNGWDVSRQSDRVRQCISLTGQFSAVDEILTGRENLEMAARLCHIKDFKGRAAELLHDFNLVEAADKRVSVYSGGMRRRLDIAMSLAGNPSVLFLDEPTTGLDPQSRNAMWSMIQELKKMGTTIFLTTQYLEEAEQLADHVAILHDGTIIAEGTVEEIKKLSSREYITFQFSNLQLMRRSQELFNHDITGADEENLSITIAVHEGMKQVSDLFIAMHKSGIEPASFSQKKASLEDVFLYLVDNKEGIRS